MTEKYNSLFDGVYSYVKGSPIAAWILLLGIVLLVIGVNGFIEDTNSSYVGVQQIEANFGIRAVSWQPTYLLMSLFFQVFSVIGFFFYLSNRERNWPWLWVSFGSQVVDFFADVWYRSNGQFFESFSSFVVSFILTFVFFTFGSEIAITLGIGLTAKLFVEGMTQFAILFKDFMRGIGKFFERVSTPSSGGQHNNSNSGNSVPLKSNYVQPAQGFHFESNEQKKGGNPNSGNTFHGNRNNRSIQ